MGLSRDGTQKPSENPSPWKRSNTMKCRFLLFFDKCPGLASRKCCGEEFHFVGDVFRVVILKTCEVVHVLKTHLSRIFGIV